MGKTYEVTQERVLEAAEECGTAKEVLKTMFPEAFEKELPIKAYGVYHFEDVYSFKDKNNYMIVRIGRTEYALANISGSDSYYGGQQATLDNLGSLFGEHIKKFTYIGQAKDVVKISPAQPCSKPK